ncbi:MAG TPA: hypothetical protein VFG54_13470 [Prolixibacteraceae bacterium]|nr:hypothetical protein [Prolixibacteraceae bacterium]
MMAKRNLLILLMVYFFLTMVSGCRVHHPQYHKKGMIISTHPAGKAPPGQVKKATGAKSAKAYAPGQNKNKKGTVSKHNQNHKKRK